MPRNNRSAALILILALLSCLVAQAATAMPVAQAVTGGSVAAGSTVTALWTWLITHVPGLAGIVTAPAGNGPRLTEKTGSTLEPNGGTNCAGMGSGLGQP